MELEQNSTERFVWHRAAVVFDVRNRVEYTDVERLRDYLHCELGLIELDQRLASLRSEAHRLAGFFCALIPGHEACMTSNGPRVLPPFRLANGNLPVFRCLTSGSTRAPVQIRRTHFSWKNSFSIHAAKWGINSQDVYCTLGNLSYSLSLFSAMEALQMGAQLHLLAGLSPAQQLAGMKRHCATILYAAPSQLNLLYAVWERTGQLQATDLRLLLLGGSKLNSKHRLAARKMFPNAEIIEFFGSAEASFIALGDEETPGQCIGKAYPRVRISIERQSKEDHCGLIRVRSPYLALGYASEVSASNLWQNGDLLTSDVGDLTEDGYLQILGRSDRCVKIADKLVCMDAIEAHIEELQDVDQVAVIPVSDSLRGTRLVAIVLALDGCDHVVEAVRTQLEKLCPLRRPKRILTVNTWPTLQSGKTDYRSLAAMVDSKNLSRHRQIAA